jgi:hypothetical protein
MHAKRENEMEKTEEEHEDFVWLGKMFARGGLSRSTRILFGLENMYMKSFWSPGRVMERTDKEHIDFIWFGKKGFQEVRAKGEKEMERIEK